MSDTCLESVPLTHIVNKAMTVRDRQPVWIYQAIKLGKRWNGLNPQRGWDGSVVLCEAKDAASCKAACREVRRD